MSKNKTINVKGTEVAIVTSNDSDFISLTDIARHKDSANMDSIIQNWLRNRNTIELLGFWETMYNPDFKPLEFEGFRKQAGLNSFVMTAKSGLKLPMPLALFQSRAGMAALMLTEILPLNLLHGFPLSSNYTSSKNFNASKPMRTTN